MFSRSDDAAGWLVVWEEAFERCLSLTPEISKWFSSVQFDGFDGERLSLVARDEFVRDWVHNRYLGLLLEELTARVGRRVEVSWSIRSELDTPVVSSEPFDVSTPDTQKRPRRLKIGERSIGSEHQISDPPGLDTLRPSERPSPPERSSVYPPNVQRVPSHSTPPAASFSAGSSRSAGSHSVPPPYIARSTTREQLNPKYTFPNFVVGPSNELAHAAIIAAAGGGGPRYNPLFICGGTGLGKTHLMHSLAHQVLESRPDACVLYVSAERFTNQFVEALQHHKMEEFRHRYRSECDLLLVDDIQFLAGREQTQEEFFHTFNALHEADKPIVVSSDKYPQDLQRMPERLISRFTSGLVADIQTPALETRVAIVRKKAQLEGIRLDDEVAVLLAQHVKSNVRELEGTLIRLAAKSSLMGSPIDLEFAKAEISMVAPRRLETRSVEDIQRAVCGHFSLSSSALLSKDRHKSVAFARQVAMYLCRQRLKCSFPELGRAFGNRDHTTVMSAVRRVAALRRSDPQVDAHLQAIENRLGTSEED